jgi:hypothetical protein
VDLGAERTARVLIDRHGSGAFDFAARQVALRYLADETASAANWRAIARAIEVLARDREH